MLKSFCVLGVGVKSTNVVLFLEQVGGSRKLILRQVRDFFLIFHGVKMVFYPEKAISEPYLTYLAHGRRLNFRKMLTLQFAKDILGYIWYPCLLPINYFTNIFVFSCSRLFCLSIYASRSFSVSWIIRYG